MKWYLKALNNFSFRGRASPAEFWLFVLFSYITSVVLVTLDAVLGTPVGEGGIGLFFALYLLATIIPSFSITARRLHDTGRSGWMMLLALTCIAIILLIVWLAEDSSPGDNQYGPNPKGA